MQKNGSTVEFYNKNALQYVSTTKDVDFHYAQDKFLSFVPVGGRVLDFGCGSGRDIKYFLSKGYEVDAVDGSEEMCRLATEFTGIEVKQMLFNELECVNLFDGIWACSSILHLSKLELKDVIYKMLNALKNKAYIYTSFKYGDFEGYRNERFFTDFKMGTFLEYIKDIDQIKVVENWISEDVRPGRGDEKWLNLILQKVDIV